MRISDQVRSKLTESGKFQLLDVSPVKAAAEGSNLQACGGCDVQFAERIGADLVITGVMKKVSTLILNLTIFVRDVHTGKLITAMNADFRGNTDEVLDARDELSRAQPAAGAQLWQAAALMNCG